MTFVVARAGVDGLTAGTDRHNAVLQWRALRGNRGAVMTLVRVWSSLHTPTAT